MINSNLILSIDPALSTTGYAIINEDTLEIVHCNKITTSRMVSEDDRVSKIVYILVDIANKYSVKCITLEDGFLGVNAKTSLQLAKLRGAIIGVFKYLNFEINYRLPKQIRKTFGCKGNAKKDEIAQCVINMYGKDSQTIKSIGPYSDKQNKDKTSDIYDAISIGISYIKANQKVGEI